MNYIKKIFKVSCVVLMVIALFCSCGPKNGLVQENGGVYYYVNGERKTGWQDIKGDKYYFYEDDYYEGEYKEKGKMMYGAWLKTRSGSYFYFDGQGKSLKDGMYKLDDGNYYCFDSNGIMMHDTQTTINGEQIIIDSQGVAKKVPEYQLVFNCTFPKLFRSGSYYWKDVIIEDIKYVVDDNYLGERVFRTYWTGTAGNTSDGPNYSTYRSVGYKLYDPDNYAISSGSFETDISLKYGEKFKDTKETIGYEKVNKKGVYRLELMDIK